MAAGTTRKGGIVGLAIHGILSGTVDATIVLGKNVKALIFFAART